jgi:DNA-binding XRE family transcriptional regulator
MQNNNIKNLNVSEENNNLDSHSSFFSTNKVIRCKNTMLKVRLQTLINSKGWKESQFYKMIGINKQNWYRLSWGLWTAPIELKVKISQALGTDSSVIFQENKK